jgi:hypothetical protein
MDKLTHAKTMRSDQTLAEQKLWYHLRAHRFMGLKFKRQKPIGPYIVDFICLEYGLVVEVDGGQHGDDVIYDRRRDRWLDLISAISQQTAPLLSPFALSVGPQGRSRRETSFDFAALRSGRTVAEIRR